MMKEKPYVWLKGHGSYYVETGGSEAGCLIRLDNFLEAFPQRVDNLRDTVKKLTARQTDIRRELANGVDYGDELENLMKKLEQIDKELGVDKK